ncbi:MAG TPA: aldo/keto reductase [Planctomycetota bacterium]|nr:aldo/keto reductase [Planctomycetota bacterium]
MNEKRIGRRRFLGQGAAVVGAGLGAAKAVAAEAQMPPKEKILSYDERMEYRRLGKTNLWVSAICLGGHWKRCPFKGEDFQKNRTEIIGRCLDSGINYVDACCEPEILAYAKALKTLGKRDKMYFGFSMCGHEVRNPGWRTRGKLLEVLDEYMKQAALDVVDLWRITMHEQSSRHTDGEVEEMMRALETAKQQGKARFVGFSSHDRPHIEKMIQAYPKIVDAICSPYTAKTKEKPEGSFFDTLRKYDIGLFGIKPFASNSIFKGKSAPDDPHREEDDRIARLALRYVLCCDVLTAPIPGLIFPHHVENCLKAIEERRKEDLAARPAVLDNAELARAADRMWERLPAGYQWLKDWEWV